MTGTDLEPYNAKVREFFAHPEHAGDLPEEPAGILRIRVSVFACQPAVPTAL